MSQPRQPAGTGDGGQFAPRDRAEAPVSLNDSATDPLADEIEARFVKPVTCRRCRGAGLVSSRVVYAGGPGGCFKCDGWGVVEGDPATIAAAKARAEAQKNIIRSVMDEAERRGMAPANANAFSYGLSHLAEHEPERYEKALNSYLAGHPGLFRAVVVYTAEKGYLRYGARQLSVAEALDRLGLS